MSYWFSHGSASVGEAAAPESLVFRILPSIIFNELHWKDICDDYVDLVSGTGSLIGRKFWWFIYARYMLKKQSLSWGGAGCGHCT